MKKCIDCDWFGGDCEKAGKVCEKYKKKIHRKYTKLDKVENGVFEFSKLEVEDDKRERRTDR